jgi:hypothetical protein
MQACKQDERKNNNRQMHQIFTHSPEPSSHRRIVAYVEDAGAPVRQVVVVGDVVVDNLRLGLDAVHHFQLQRRFRHFHFLQQLGHLICNICAVEDIITE